MWEPFLCSSFVGARGAYRVGEAGSKPIFSNFRAIRGHAESSQYPDPFADPRGSHPAFPPVAGGDRGVAPAQADRLCTGVRPLLPDGHYRLFRSEEHTSELQSLMRISYAVFCL